MRWKSPEFHNLGWPFGREEARSTYQTTTRCIPFKGLYWALWKRHNMLRWSYHRLCQVWFKEMKEKRLNHCRGIVTNSVDTQNRRGQRPKETSHVNVHSRNRCHDGYPVYRWHDFESGSFTEQGNLPICIRGKAISPKGIKLILSR